MTVKGTPEARFDGLEKWPYGPQYLTDLNAANGIRVHYVDVGKVKSDRVFLCPHGQPSWAYLYRKMISVLAAARARMVAPDLPGIGWSDKPVAETTYGFGFHRQILLDFIGRLNLHNTTLVVQDWGGLLGLTLPMDRPDRINRMLVMNTTLAIGYSNGKGFDQWRAYCRSHPDLKISRLMQRTCPNLTLPEAHAYDAPFPDASYKARVRRSPEMVMTAPDMEGWQFQSAPLNIYPTHGKAKASRRLACAIPCSGYGYGGAARRDPRLPGTARNCRWWTFFIGMERAGCRSRPAPLGRHQVRVIE
jgi:haloalkane dehalogenase